MTLYRIGLVLAVRRGFSIKENEMILEHIAIWTRNIEEMKDFYVQYFGGTHKEKYTSEKDFNAHFESYFLSFGGECRLELMNLGRIPEGDSANGNETIGLTHFSFAMKERAELDALAARLAADGHRLIGKPHETGDGFYEGCVLDPDGNRVEFCVVPE